MKFALTLISLIQLSTADECQVLCVRYLGESGCTRGTYCKSNGICQGLHWTTDRRDGVCVHGESPDCPATYPVSCSEARFRSETVSHSALVTPTPSVRRNYGDQEFQTFVSMLHDVATALDRTNHTDEELQNINRVLITLGHAISNSSRTDSASEDAGFHEDMRGLEILGGLIDTLSRLNTTDEADQYLVDMFRVDEEVQSINRTRHVERPRNHHGRHHGNTTNNRMVSRENRPRELRLRNRPMRPTHSTGPIFCMPVGSRPVTSCCGESADHHDADSLHHSDCEEDHEHHHDDHH